MARKTISQRIALEGGDQIKKQLAQLGEEGERAFTDIQKAATKLKGPGAEFARSLDTAIKKARELGDGFKRVGESMRNVGAGLSVAVTAPVVAAGAKALSAWKVQEDAIKRVEAALRSTGNTVGFTSEELQAMASEMQKVTTFGDEAILKMQSVLMTFTNIKGDQFKGATEAVLDLSAALGMDLQSAATQLGKALQDPIAGINSLKRAGIDFSPAQREMIKNLIESGNLLEAQQVILDAIAGQYGTFAEDLAKTDFGKYDQAINNLGDAWERVGEALVPIIGKMAGAVDSITAFVNKAVDAFMKLPEAMQKNIILFGVLAGAIFPVLAAIGQAVIGIGGLLFVFANMGGLMAPIVGMFTGLSAAFGSLGPIIAAILAPLMTLPVALAAIGAGLVLLYQNWDSIWTKMQEVLGPVGAKIAVVVAAFGAIGGAVAIAVSALGGLLPSAIAVAAALGKIGALVAPIVASFASLGGAGGGLMAAMGALGPVLASIGAVFLSWPVLIGLLVVAFAGLAVAVVRDWDTIKAAVSDGAAAIEEKAISLRERLGTAAEGMFKKFLTEIIGFEGEWTDSFARILRFVTVDWLGGIHAAVSKAVKFATDAAKKIASAFSSGGSTGSGSSSGGDGILRNFASGGRVRGPGTSTSDSILARLSNNEFVIQARSVRHYGAALFDLLNRRRLPREIVASPSRSRSGQPAALTEAEALRALLRRLQNATKGTPPGYASGGLVQNIATARESGGRLAEVLKRLRPSEGTSIVARHRS